MCTEEQDNWQTDVRNVPVERVIQRRRRSKNCRITEAKELKRANGLVRYMIRKTSRFMEDLLTLYEKYHLEKNEIGGDLL